MVTRERSRPASAEQRLKELGIKLPAPPEPFGTYVEAVQTGNLLFLSGMLPTEGHGAKFIGRVGAELDVETGRKAAHLAALNGGRSRRARACQVVRSVQRTPGRLLTPPDWVSSPQDQSSTGPSVCQSVPPNHSARQEATAGSGSDQDGDRRLDDYASRCGVHPVTIPAISRGCPPLNTDRLNGMLETDRFVLLC